MRYARLALPTQTLYARLLDLLMATDAGDLAAGTSLVSKLIAGHRYWYAQRTHAGSKVQVYLGRETPELMKLIERWRQARAEEASRAELVAMARAGGAYTVSAAEARVLESLAPAFRIGGVLVGSHAFSVLGNMLGVRWADAIVRTDDVDVAQDPRIAIALAMEAEPIELPKTLGDAIPKFSILNPDEPATTFKVRGTEIEVDLLTPLVGRPRPAPVRIPALGAAAMPLRFLDYLIEETQPGVVLGGHGVLVNVPRPGRFALHKLIVARRRRMPSRTKAAKDRAQASALLDILLADLPGELSLAWKALEGRGKAWVHAVRESVKDLEPDLVAGLGILGIKPLATRS